MSPSTGILTESDRSSHLRRQGMYGYEQMEMSNLLKGYDDLIDFHRTASRAQDRASARVALAPIVKELERRGVVDCPIPPWTAKDVEEYKAEMEGKS